MSRAVLSLGSNLADPAAQLRNAALELAPWTVARSSMYATAPWGPVDQPDFLNAVLIVVDPEAAPSTWLARAHLLERRAGRDRGVRYGPRALDVDVITVDDVRTDDPELTLPHPRAHERAFVLVPWLEIEPDADFPGRGRVAALVAALPAPELAGVSLRPDQDWNA